MLGVFPRMSPNENEIQAVQNLEHEADTLLAELATSTLPASRGTLLTLERIAATAARIAYGTGSPRLISEQMRALIDWTDHLDDEAWCALFQQTLRTRPLRSPYGHNAAS